MTPRGARTTRRTGLTLVETIVVVGIIMVLLGLALAAVQTSRRAAARAACANNLRQLGVAAHLHAAAHGALPQGCQYPFATDANPSLRQAGLSWHTTLLPYVEQGALWELSWRANTADPIGLNPIHASVMAHTVPVFRCAAESRPTGTNGVGLVWGLTSFVGVAGTHRRRNDGVFHPALTVRLGDITDGTSNTVMIGERPPGPSGRFGGWYANWGSLSCTLAQILPTGSGWVMMPRCPRSPSLAPGNPADECSVWHFWSPHPGGAHFAFADGSVRFLRYEAVAILPALATRAEGEAVTAPD